jgi:hypothetical protein
VACRQSFVDPTTASAGMTGLSLSATEREDGGERVDREASRQEEQGKPHPARLEAR